MDSSEFSSALSWGRLGPHSHRWCSIRGKSEPNNSALPSGPLSGMLKTGAWNCRDFLIGDSLKRASCLSFFFAKVNIENAYFVPTGNPRAIFRWFLVSLESFSLVGEFCILHVKMSMDLTVGPQGVLLFLFALMLLSFVTSNTPLCSRGDT